MTGSPKLNRRLFMAGQASFATLGAAGVAGASTHSSWKTLGHKNLEPLIGDKFTARTEAGDIMTLKLVDSSPVKSGWHRPVHLKRREGVVATFESNGAAAYAEAGDRVVTMTHKELGRFDVFLSATQKKSGGFELEVVLN
ncbi:MAG: hypothetical protein ABJN69_16980 [Hellea sp.]